MQYTTPLHTRTYFIVYKDGENKVFELVILAFFILISSLLVLVIGLFWFLGSYFTLTTNDEKDFMKQELIKVSFISSFFLVGSIIFLLAFYFSI